MRQVDQPEPSGEALKYLAAKEVHGHASLSGEQAG